MGFINVTGSILKQRRKSSSVPDVSWVVSKLRKISLMYIIAFRNDFVLIDSSLLFCILASIFTVCI